MITKSISQRRSRLGAISEVAALLLRAMLRRAAERRDYARVCRLPDYLLDDIGEDRHEIRRRMPPSAWSLLLPTFAADGRGLR